MTSSNAEPARLARRLGPLSATVLGLGSMLGAGVFTAFAPAAAAAGTSLLIGLAIAGLIAYCNATASAQLAAVYPTSGGTYVYGRERLGHWWGFTAGWGFVVGKTASCTAMALTFGAYVGSELAPGYERPLAIAAVLALATVNYLGVTRTATAARVLLAIVLAVLAFVVVAGFSATAPDRLGPAGAWFAGGPLGVLQAAGLLFFAFAGYARLATMAEEVREPRRTIPRAITAALVGALLIYLLVGISTLLAVGPERLADSRAPLRTAMVAAGWAELSPLVTVGAVAGSLGALLALMAGVGRTTLAMARNRDLPSWLAGVHPGFQVPHRAEVTLALVVCGLAAVVDLRAAIGFSSFGVLIYYAIANAAAYSQPAADRRMPRSLNVLGVGGCVVLAVTLPVWSVIAGVATFAVGIAGRAVGRMLARRSERRGA